jgi:sulfate permease, SulP family
MGERLKWPSSDLWRGEMLAGLTVGLTVIPQGVAYAQLAGMPLITGVYASLLPALVAAIWGSSPRLSVGPTALSALLVFASLQPLAQPGSPQWVMLAIWLALLTGGLQILLGLGRFGWLLSLISTPVMTAFTQAAALLIMLSQLPALAGWPVAASWLQGWQNLNPAALAFGLGTLLALGLIRRLSRLLPAVLVVMMASAGISRAIGFEASGGAVVGALPAGLPALALPSWPGWDTLSALAWPTLVLTLVSFLETASSAKVDHDSGESRWRPDRDLVAQGLAKLASALSGAFPTSSSFSRSALNLYAGAKTAWASVFSVVTVAVGLFVLMPVLHHVPQAVLSAIVIASVWGVLKPARLWQVWRVSKVEAGIAGATLVGTLIWAPRLHWGVALGMVLALIHFLYQRLHPRIIEVGVHVDGRLRDRHVWQLPPIAPRTLALRMDADLDFGSAAALETWLGDALAAQPEARHVVLLAQPINHVDASGVELFDRLRQRLSAQGRVFHVVGLKLPVERRLRAAGTLSPETGVVLHVTDEQMLTYLKQAGDAP